MNKHLSFLSSLLLSGILMVLSVPLQGSNSCSLEPLDIVVEARIAYYHPSSSKVRKIYSDGWADYQIEISRGIGYNLRAWAGVSGFLRKGASRPFHDGTKLQMIPISLGLKYVYPLFCDLNLVVGGAVCYSFLRIHDNSDYVRKHLHKDNWGGLIQSALSYNFCDWAVASVFADYFFQQFHFHSSHKHGYRGSYYYYDSRYIGRSNLDMSGYKIGVGLGLVF